MSNFYLSELDIHLSNKNRKPEIYLLKLFWRTPYLNIRESPRVHPISAILAILDQFDFDSDLISQNSYLLLFDRWFNLFGFLTRSQRVPILSIV